jgi:hypothetical protein
LNTNCRFALAAVIGTRNLGWRTEPEEDLVAWMNASSGGLEGSGFALSRFSALTHFLEPLGKLKDHEEKSRLAGLFFSPRIYLGVDVIGQRQRSTSRIFGGAFAEENRPCGRSRIKT